MSDTANPLLFAVQNANAILDAIGYASADAGVVFLDDEGAIRIRRALSPETVSQEIVGRARAIRVVLHGSGPEIESAVGALHTDAIGHARTRSPASSQQLAESALELGRALARAGRTLPVA